MDHVLQSVPAATNYDKCSACKKSIDSGLLYKTCSPCRAKKREKKRLSKEKSRAAGASMKDLRKNATNTHSNESRKVVAGDKRKAQKSLYELEGEERNVAMKMMKSSLKPIIRQNLKEPLTIPADKSVTSGQEHQTASSLYDVLKSQALSSYPASKDETNFLQFLGCHTIVAVSSIDNTKRSNLVATDLRKIARLPFELGHSTLLPGPSGTVTLSYPCSCVGPTQAVTPPGAEKSNGPGSLIRWARAGFISTASQAVPCMCGGKISVTVSDDTTHPLDIPGQQIIVRVEHPNV